MDVASIFAFFLRVIRRHKAVLVEGFCVLTVCVGVLGVSHGVFAAPEEIVDSAALGQGAIDQLVNLVAQFFNWIATAIGQLILVLIGMILIPILHYDGFSSSYIVGLGWALTRDIVNMFVVIVLLVISVLTIVGSPKANWQQQIPRLFIYVIAVNFSRTICGFLIDIGNIIMFQFVNALVEIGAGNFAQLLKLNAVGDYTSDLTKGVHAWQNLGASWLQVALMTMVLAVIGILVIVMLYRIVFLWVLIILSPAAFFLGGIKDVFSQAGSAYGEWWKKFTSAIILGPILTFFLWLALAVSASGDIVTKENFPVGTTENVSGLVLKAFDISQMTGLLLGLVLLVVGMQQASSAAGAMGGLAAKFVNEGTGASLAKASLKWPSTFGRGASAVGSGAYKTANYIAPETTAALTASTLQGVGKLQSKAGTALSSSPLAAIPGVGYVGRKVSERGNKTYAAGEHMSEEETKKAQEGFKNAPEEYKQKMYHSMATGGRAHESLTATQQQVLRLGLATSLRDQKNVEEKLKPEEYEKLMAKVMKETQHDADNGHLDDAQKKAFEGTKTKHIDILLETDTAAAQKHIDSEDFNPALIRKRALEGKPDAAGNMSDAAMASLNTVRKSLDGRVMRVTDDGKEITALHEAASHSATRQSTGRGAARAPSTPSGIPVYAGSEDPRVKEAKAKARAAAAAAGTPPAPSVPPPPLPPARPAPPPSPTLPTPPSAPPPLPRPRPGTIPPSGGTP